MHIWRVFRHTVQKRVESWSLGELILKEDEIVITFKKEKEEEMKETAIGRDSNLFSLDGFSPRYLDKRGFVLSHTQISRD